MAAKTINAAFRDRWNALSYNTTISELRLGMEKMGFGNAPEQDDDGDDTVMPRAEIFVSQESRVLDYTAARIKESEVEIRIFHNDADVLSGWLSEIEDAFDNSEKAGTSPAVLDVDYGDLMDVRYEGRELVQLDKNVVLGSVWFAATWSKAFSIPS